MNRPTIRGIFVNSHIEAVRKKKGEAGVRELERKCGKPLHFRNTAHVPVREEVKLIEAALEVQTGRSFSQEELEFEAGRLHFKNFRTTPLARLIFALFRRRFKLLMMQAPNIAGHVFEGVRFSSKDLGSRGVRVIMENNDYPIDHFRGLFQEWLEFSGLTGKVEGEETAPNRYEYTMKW